MSATPRRLSNWPSPIGKNAEVRPAVGADERRRKHRRPSDAEIEILSPIQGIASALDVSGTGIQLSLDDWLAAGTVCDLRITTHTGRMILKRARVIWTRRVGERCVSGLEVVGSIAPHTPDED